MVLGRRRRKRSLLNVRPLTLNLGKQRVNLANKTTSLQVNKTANGSGTIGNLAFALNKPASAYIWSNPLVRVFKGGAGPNKQLQWQFNKGTGQQATAAATSAASTTSQVSAAPSPPGGGGAPAPGGTRGGQTSAAASTARPANPPAG